MDEYIERDAAIRVVNGQSSLTMTRSSLIDSISKLPAADVAPVVHGRWISFLDGDYIMPERYYRCSRCGRVESRRQPYCHCGAIMDLEG